MSGQALVHGEGAAGGTISGGATHFTGTATNNAAHIDMPSVDCPTTGYSAVAALGLPCAGCTYNPLTGNLTISGGDKNINLPAINGVNYYFNDITLSGGSTMTVCAYAGPLVAGACPPSGSPAPHVNIYIAGELDASGGSFVNRTSDATKLTVIGCGSNATAWALSGQTGAYYGLYAPNHALTISGGSDIWGAVVADFDTESGGAHVHYDQALSRMPWDFTGRNSVIRGTWRER